MIVVKLYHCSQGVSVARLTISEYLNSEKLSSGFAGFPFERYFDMTIVDFSRKGSEDNSTNIVRIDPIATINENHVHNHFYFLCSTSEKEKSELLESSNGSRPDDKKRS